MKHRNLIYAADQPHGVITWSKKGTEGLAAMWGLAFPFKVSLLLSFSSFAPLISIPPSPLYFTGCV